MNKANGMWSRLKLVIFIVFRLALGLSFIAAGYSLPNMFDWHNFLGYYSGVALILIGLTLVFSIF